MVQIFTCLSVLSPSMATASENGVAGRGREQTIGGKIFAMESKCWRNLSTYRNMCAFVVLQY
jgi:hypothetical protein